MKKNKEHSLGLLNKIKKLAVIAMVSDDELLDQLVLKGGNAIDLIYKISSRSSIDLDFSMEHEFNSKELSHIKDKIEKLLKSTFYSSRLSVFDVKLSEQPKIINGIQKTFWGGYRVEFKVIPIEIYEENLNNIEFLRNYATVIGPYGTTVFKIDISRFECCKEKITKEIDGYTIYVYTPEMIICEKLRAICQQIPEYKKIVKRHAETARARDFFDIYILIEHFSIDLNEKKNKTLLKEMFAIKRVPLSFLSNVKGYREFHRQDFVSLKDTVSSAIQLKEFDYYFDYVIDKINSIRF
jgi:predicted nucleotidyltransferase component of viral defense system